MKRRTCLAATALFACGGLGAENKATPKGTIPRRIVPAKGEKGTQLLAALLMLNDHGTTQDCRVFSAGIEVENLSGHEVHIQFDPKDLRLELLDSTGKPVPLKNSPRSGPAPLTHLAGLPTSSYIGLSTYRGGIGLPSDGLLFAAGWQDWVVKPGEYRMSGIVTLSAAFSHPVLDPEKPTRPPPKNADKRIPAPPRITLKLAETPLFALPGE